MNTKSILALLASLFAAVVTLLPAQAHASSIPGPQVVFEFSRGEEGAAIGCQPSDAGGMLTNVVAPLMQSEGLTAITTVNSLATGNTEGCTHSDESLTSSWGDLTTLAGYGWNAVPHEYDGPAKLATLTPQQDWNVTCGQAVTLQSHGLTGTTGLIAYPGAQNSNPDVLALQANYGANCFDFGRTYSQKMNGLTTQAQGLTSPYWAYARALKGGPGVGSAMYTTPASVIKQMQSLQPGQMLIVQMYLLVTGVNPAGDSITWDCNDGDVHQSSDVERYCLSDAEQVFAAASQLQASGQITVTTPAAVAVLWGRTPAGMTKP